MKQFFFKLLAFAFLVCSVLFVGTACSSPEQIDSGGDDQIYLVYTTYVADAKENGENPLSYEECLQQSKVKKGITVWTVFLLSFK